MSECKYGEDCVSYLCKKSHPNEEFRMTIKCKDKDCRYDDCDLLHPQHCFDGLNCKLPRDKCKFRHLKLDNSTVGLIQTLQRKNKKSKHPQKCRYGKDCINYWCHRDHPAGRKVPCEYRDCGDAYCNFLHPRFCADENSSHCDNFFDCRFRHERVYLQN